MTKCIMKGCKNQRYEGYVMCKTHWKAYECTFFFYSDGWIEDPERIKKMNKNEMIGGRGPFISKKEWDRRKAETELIFFINDIVKKYDLNVSDVTKTLLTIFNMKYHREVSPDCKNETNMENREASAKLVQYILQDQKEEGW